MKNEYRFLAHNQALMLLLLTVVLIMSAGCAEQASQQAREAADEGRQQLEQFASGEGTSSPDAGGGSTHQVTVSRVKDGDTVEIEPAINGRTDLRLIGVDTPELADSEPLAQEAADFTTRRLEGERVTLTLGRDPVDPYERLLGVVKPDGQQRTHGARLLELGYAQTLFYEPNTEYRPLYSAIQEDARQSQAGIWGLPLQQQCQLADRGNGVGKGSAECLAA